MDNLDAALDAIYAETDAAAEAVEVVADEATTETPAEVAADEVAEETDEAAEESVETDDAAETDDTEPVGHDDELSALLEDIPSPESINAEFNRVPLAARERMISLADGWRQDRALIEEIGGRDTAEILKPIADMLHKSERSSDDLVSALGSLATMNPLATAELLVKGANEVLFNTDQSPAMRDAAMAGDAVLEARFGEGVTAEHIEKLVMLEQGGYIDVENDMSILESEGTGSKLFESQKAVIDNQNAKIAELENLIKNPDQIKKDTGSSRLLDTELERRFSEGTEPFRERVRWGKDSALMQIASKAILSDLRNDPEYKEAVALAKQAGQLGEKLPTAVERKLYVLTNKAKAKFAEYATGVNKDVAGMAQTSQNAKLSKESPKVTPKPVVLQNVPTSTFGGVLSIDDKLAAIYGETDNKLRAAGGN